VVVVLTEFVVILAFASRFYFDKALNDRMENLESKLAVIESYYDVEIETREVLAKQRALEDLQKNQIGLSDRLDLLSTSLSSDIVLDEASFDTNQTTIKGQAGSEAGFARSMILLRSNEDIKRIDLDQAVFDQSVGSLRFAIKIQHNR
jgi:hypothetical protein